METRKSNIRLTDIELRNCQLEVLKEFHDFCDSCSLKYYMVYGTLLGAVRHKGYIPWDDDIDVAMPREDYEVFLRHYNSGLADRNSKAIDISIDDNYYLDFAKVYHTKTILTEFIHNPLPIGAYVDVFPIDKMPDNVAEAEKTLKAIMKLEKQLQIHNRTGSQGNGRILKTMVHNFHRLSLQSSRSQTIKEIIALGRKYKYSNFKHVSIATGGFPLLKDYVIEEWYGEPIQLEFEGENFLAPANSSALLAQWYGDYMTPPSKEKQKSHHLFDAYWK